MKFFLILPQSMYDKLDTMSQLSSKACKIIMFNYTLLDVRQDVHIR